MAHLYQIWKILQKNKCLNEDKYSDSWSYHISDGLEKS